MKQILIFILVAKALNTSAQNSGVYLTRMDYEKNVLSYSTKCNSSHDKIKLNDFFAKKFIMVLSQGKNIKLGKDSIYGYCDCFKNTYRFYNSYDKEFKIVEEKEITIYVSDVNIYYSTGKPEKVIHEFYFSKKGDSPLYPLTILNVKKAFPGNLQIHDALNLEFSSEKDISSYDDIHKSYSINYLLSQFKF